MANGDSIHLADEKASKRIDCVQTI